VGAIAGASWSRLVQYAVLGAVVGLAVQLIGVHSSTEAAMRPARVAIAGDTGIGDSLPRSRPTFAAWSSVLMLAVAFAFAVAGAMLAAVFDRVSEVPVLGVVIASALTLGFGVPMTVGVAFSPSLQPIRDLAEGTERVAAGDYSRRVPAVQDDDLGALAASFNRMQAGLAERQRLQAAFGTYVDPALAARLLQQGDDVFTGERRQVTVMFVDIRDFTPFAEANSAEDTVARLNALFEIVVPAVVDAGGHVNKFLGDGALAVFGAPNDLADHADAAVRAAVLIHRLVAERFGGTLRIGIAINTGVVIAGTIGGGGKLEFTLIGDTVNVAARVEQLTKTTGDAILHPTVHRRPGFSSARTHRPGIRCPERQVGRRAGFRPRPGDHPVLLTPSTLTPSTPFAYSQVVSRCFAYPRSAFPLVSTFSGTGSNPGSSTKRAADQRPFSFHDWSYINTSPTIGFPGNRPRSEGKTVIGRSSASHNGAHRAHGFGARTLARLR
jgi:class 3 adenylate cyclase